MPRRHRRRAALRIGVSKQYPRSAPLNRGRAIGTVPVVARHFRHCSRDQRVARTGNPALIAKYPMEYPSSPFKDQATDISVGAPTNVNRSAVYRQCDPVRFSEEDQRVLTGDCHLTLLACGAGGAAEADPLALAGEHALRPRMQCRLASRPTDGPSSTGSSARCSTEEHPRSSRLRPPAPDEAVPRTGHGRG